MLLEDRIRGPNSRDVMAQENFFNSQSPALHFFSTFTEFMPRQLIFQKKQKKVSATVVSSSITVNRQCTDGPLNGNTSLVTHSNSNFLLLLFCAQPFSTAFVSS